LTYGVLGHFERDLDVTLRAEIVYLCGLHLGNNVYEVGAVGKITIVEMEFVRPLVLILDAREEMVLEIRLCDAGRGLYTA
jgi:hypothetical protein